MSRLESWERRTGPVLTLAAVLSLVSLIVESALDLRTRSALIVDYIVWAMFLGDYLVRLYLAEDRWRFVRRHPLDLIAVLAPAFRSLRLLTAVARMGAVAQRGTAERVIAPTVLIALTVVVAGAALALEAEREAENATILDYGEAVWWALTTVTTVGYGDRFPVTAEGRVIGGVLMIVGIAAMGAVTAAIATRLIRTSEADQPPEQVERLRLVEEQLARLTSLIEARIPAQNPLPATDQPPADDQPSADNPAARRH